MSTSSFITNHQAGGVVTSPASPSAGATVRCHNLRFVTLSTGETVLCPVGVLRHSSPAHGNLLSR